MPAQFDPADIVPDAYDVFCEGCGYSLAGLTGDRCPECGNTFNPNDLPFARVPWLHRKRLGRVKAYWKTVAMVSFSPRRFARELCRPVRISVKDAQRFRRTTLLVATLSAAVTYGVVPLIAALWMFLALTRPRQGLMMPRVWRNIVPTMSLVLLNVLAVVAAFHFLLRLMTDMPLFIWKGLPSLPPSQLAPVHHYACAPLAFAPIGALIGGALMIPLIGGHNEPVIIATCAVAGVIAIWLWRVALVLMKESSGAGPGRVIAMAVYLPLHWLIMFALVWLLMATFVFGETLALNALHIRL